MSPIYINNSKIESIYTNNQSIGKVFVGDVLVFQKNTYNGDPFIFTIDTTLGSGNSFDLPLRSGYNYDMLVNWGDGSTDIITSFDQIEKLHSYSTGGIYTITITGLCEAWYFNNSGDRLKLVSIQNWGDTGFINMEYAFSRCTNLTTISDDDGNWCENVTNMSGMFSNCNYLTTLDVSNWNVSNVTNMSGMFAVWGYTPHNLSNLNLNNWNTINVTNMSNMFEYNVGLESVNISNLNVSNVTNMNRMFHDCSSLTTLDLNNWNVSNVTTMERIFAGCYSLTTLSISNWNVGNVVNMDMCFGNLRLTAIDVSNWDVSNVTTMRNIFWSCPNLTTLNLSNWDIRNVNDIYNIFHATPINTPSYDALLIGWSALSSLTPGLQPNLSLTAELSKYSAGAATTARGVLTSAPNNWTIIDGGQL